MTTKNKNSHLYYKESVRFNKLKENSTSQRYLKLLLQHQINDKNDKNINNYCKKYNNTNIDNYNNNNDCDHHSGDNNSDNNNINESKDTDNNKSRQHYSSEFIKDWLHQFLDLKLQRLENNLEITNDQIRIELNKILQVNIKSSTVSRIINKVMKGRIMKKNDDDDDNNNRSNIRDGQNNFMDDNNDHNIDNDHNDSSEYNSIGQSLKDDADDDYIVIGKKKYGKYLFEEKVNQIHHLETLKKDKNDLIKAQKLVLKEHKKGMKRKHGETGTTMMMMMDSTATTSIVPTSTSAIGDMSGSSNQLMLHHHLHQHEFNHDVRDDDESDDNCNNTSTFHVDNNYYHNSSSVLLIPDQYHDQQELNNHLNSKIIKTKRHHYSSEFVTKWLNKFLELKADSHLNKTSLTHHQARLILNDYFNVEIKPATANRFIHKLTKSSRNEVYHRRGRKINIDFEVEVLNELIRSKNREGNYLNVVGEYISCTYECFRIAGKIVQSYENYQDDNSVQRLQFSDHWVENLIQRYQSNRLRCITDEGNVFIIGDGIHGNYCLDIRRRQENVRFIDIYLCDYIDNENAYKGNNNKGDYHQDRSDNYDHSQDGNDDDIDDENNNDAHKKGKKNIKGKNDDIRNVSTTTSHVKNKKQKKQHDSSELVRKSSSSVTRRQASSTSRRHEKYTVSDHKNDDDAINFNKDDHSDKIDIVDDNDDSDDSEDDK